MSVDMKIWRIEGEEVQIVSLGGMDLEDRLETVIDKSPSIIDENQNLMVIGRQVSIADGRIDLLAIDVDGNLTAIELKRDKTPRNVVAQALDYGSAVKAMTSKEIASNFDDYQRRFRGVERPEAIDDAFERRFKKRLPDDLNSSHSLMIVAAEVDAATERIVRYLRKEYSVPIDVVFFCAFKDGDHQYLARSWMSEPEEESRATGGGEWNGEYYAAFGVRDDDAYYRSWGDARKYGFICAGGGNWYVSPLRMLELGARVWVSVPGRGYVGVGEVVAHAAHFSEFKVDVNGVPTPITEVDLEATHPFEEGYDQHFVGVSWIKEFDLEKAVRERGFFSARNIVARPRSDKWDHTVRRLKNLWGVE